MDCSWATGGWTNQEDMLSYRKLLFGRSMLYFHRNGLTHREDAAVREHNRSDIFSGMAQAEGVLDDLYQVWDNLLESYTDREFTSYAGSLPAISGLAREFARRIQDTYMA